MSRMPYSKRQMTPSSGGDCHRCQSEGKECLRDLTEGDLAGITDRVTGLGGEIVRGNGSVKNAPKTKRPGRSFTKCTNCILNNHRCDTKRGSVNCKLCIKKKVVCQRTSEFTRNNLPSGSDPSRVFTGVLNLRVTSDTPGIITHCMALLRSAIEISPTTNSNAAQALLDRPIRFTSTESVLDDMMSFFCRETFCIPASLAEYRDVYVNFICEDTTCNKHIKTSIASLWKHFFRPRLIFLCRRGHPSAPETTSEQWRKRLPILSPRHSSIA